MDIGADAGAKSRATWMASACLMVMVAWNYGGDILRWLQPAPPEVSGALAATVFLNGCLDWSNGNLSETASKLDAFGLSSVLEQTGLTASRQIPDRSITYAASLMPPQCLVTAYTPEHSEILGQIRDHLKKNYNDAEWNELNLPELSLLGMPEGAAGFIIQTSEIKLLLTILRSPKGFAVMLATKG